MAGEVDDVLTTWQLVDTTISGSLVSNQPGTGASDRWLSAHLKRQCTYTLTSLNQHSNVCR